MKTLIIDSKKQKTLAKTMIDEMPTDGSEQVEFKKVDKSPTARQMRLRFQWMGEVADSGIGKFDTKHGVDLGAKYQFGVPILKRDDDLFVMMWEHFIETIEPYVNSSALIKQFVERHLSISKLMSRKQQAEYLTNFQRYWSRKGIALSDPADYNVDLKYNLRDKK